MFSELVRRSALLALALVATGLALAGAQRQQPFRASVNAVRVDVIVTDGQAQFVTGLSRDDFRIFEDGAQQTILDVELIEEAATRISAAGAAADSTPLQPGTDASASPGPAADSTAAPARGPAVPGDSGPAIILVVDLEGLGQAGKARFGSHWETWLGPVETFGVPRAVYLLRRAGVLQEIVPLTTSGDQVRAAAATILSSGTTRAPIEQRLMALAVIDAERRSTLRPGVADRMLGADIAEAGQTQRERAARTLEALTELCLSLEAREARTALVWVSSALQLARTGPWALLLNPGASAVAGPSGGRGAPSGGARGVASPPVVNAEVEATLPDPELLELQQRFHQAANRANVAIYSIDPSTRSVFGIDASLGGVDGLGGGNGSSATAALRSTRMREAVDGLRDEFREAAEDTGGRAYLYSADLGQIMPQIENDVRRTYLLTYSSPRQQSDGRYHEIRVEVRHPGARVRARRGYTDLTVAERDARRAMSALALPGVAADLGLPVSAARRFSPAGQMIVELAVGLDWLQPGAASQAAPLEFHAIAVNADGRIDQRLDETLAPRGFTWAQLGTYARAWPLEVGEYQLRVTLADPLSGTIAAAAVDVAVPPPGGWLPSDLMLYFSNGSEAPRPLIDTVDVEDLVVAYAELSGGQAPILSGQILDAAGTVRLHTLDATALTVDAAGIHRGGLPLPALPAARYLLQIALTDSPAGRSRIYRQALHVRPPPR